MLLNGEVCVRTSGSPKCCPQTGKRDVSPAAAPKLDDAVGDGRANKVHSHDGLILLSEKKGGVGGGAHGSGHT